MTTTQTETVTLTFLERLTIAVGRTGMGKTELARWLEMNPASISRWFMGDTMPRAATLRLIALEANVPYEWLKPGPDDEDPALVVHPLGLEPRTHWLRAWDVVGAAENLLTLAALDFDRHARCGHDARA